MPQCHGILLSTEVSCSKQDASVLRKSKMPWSYPVAKQGTRHYLTLQCKVFINNVKISFSDCLFESFCSVDNDQRWALPMTYSKREIGSAKALVGAYDISGTFPMALTSQLIPCRPLALGIRATEKWAARECQIRRSLAARFSLCEVSWQSSFTQPNQVHKAKRVTAQYFTNYSGPNRVHKRGIELTKRSERHDWTQSYPPPLTSRWFYKVESAAVAAAVVTLRKQCLFTSQIEAKTLSLGFTRVWCIARYFGI